MFEDIYKDHHFATKLYAVLRFANAVKSKQVENVLSFEFKSEEEKYTYLVNIRNKPVQTFETWNPVFGKKDLKRLSKKRKLEEEEVLETEAVEDEREEEDEDDDLLTKTSLDGVFEKMKFQVISKGFELAPPNLVMKSQGNRKLNVNVISFNRFNIAVLNNLMQLSMLRKQWETAYNCFCLLIRMRNSDLKIFWPIGLEILIRLEESRLNLDIKQQGSLELNSYQTRILTNYPRGQKIPPFLMKLDKQNMQDLEQMIEESNSHKIEKYLNWLKNFYGVVRVSRSRNYPAAWLSGAKNVVPLYYESLAWSFLVRLDFKNCKDLLQDLILQQPFSEHGVFHYMLGLCFQIEATYAYDMKILSFKEINDLLMSSLRNFQKASNDYDIEISDDILQDLHNSFKLIGINHVKSLFNNFKKNAKEAKKASFLSTPSSQHTDSTPSSPSSLPSSPVSQIIKTEPHIESDLDLGDETQDEKMIQDLDSLTLTPVSPRVSSSHQYEDQDHDHYQDQDQQISPISQIQFSPLVQNTGHEQRQRTRGLDHLDSLLDFGESEMTFEFDDDSLSSD